MALFVTDTYEFGYSGDKKVCRGKPHLSQIVREMKEGVTPYIKTSTPGGFSTNITPCKKFSRRESERAGDFDPPAVYVNDYWRMQKKYPSMMEVCYTEEWLKAHPDAVDTMQTLDCFVDRPLEDKISSCMCYKSECEVVFPGVEKLEYPGYSINEETGKERDWGGGHIDVFISDTELDDLSYHGEINRASNYRTPISKLKEVMDVAETKIEAMVPKDLKIDYINIYACNGTINLDTEKCILHKSIGQKERKKQE